MFFLAEKEVMRENIGEYVFILMTSNDVLNMKLYFMNFKTTTCDSSYEKSS